MTAPTARGPRASLLRPARRLPPRLLPWAMGALWLVLGGAFALLGARLGVGRDALIPLGLAATLLALVLSRAQPATVLVLLFAWFAFQNLVVIPLSELTLPATTKGLLALKELVIFGIAGLWILDGRVPRGRLFAVALAFIGLNLAGALLSARGLMVVASTLRQNVVLVVMLLFGMQMRLSDAQARAAARGLLTLSAALVAFGFIERFALGDRFWLSWGVYEFASDKGFAERFIFQASGLPGNFTFYDLGFPVRRMVSALADPTLFSHFLALPAIITLAAGEALGVRRRRLLLITFLAGIGLSFGRGGMLTFAVGAGVWYASLRGAIPWRWIAGLGLAGIFVTLALPGDGNLFAFHEKSSGAIHLRGLFENMAALREAPLGRGLGTAGNLAKVFGDLDATRGAGESFIGALVYQLGVPGLILWVTLLLGTSAALLRQADTHLGIRGALSRAVGASLPGVLLTSAVSESAVALTGSGLFFLLAGALLRPPAPRAEASGTAPEPARASPSGGEA